MSHWDARAGTIVRWPDKTWDQYPEWISRDCGCCGGIEWGGDSPRECRNCGGFGRIAKHKKSGALAAWPGGPFLGREEPDV